MPATGDIPPGSPHHPAESPAPAPDHNWKPFTPPGATTTSAYSTETTIRNITTPRQDVQTPSEADGTTGQENSTAGLPSGTTGPDSDAAGRSDIRALVKVLRPGSASRRARAIVRDVLQQAGPPEDDIDTAELIVAELAANAEKHARPPYELRVFSLDGTPSWCEVVDGDPDTHEVRLILNLLHSVQEIGLPLLAENGRSLLLAHRLSHGHCRTYPVTTLAGAPGKAVAFALPTRSGDRLILSSLPCLHRRSTS
ncbi:ATP-binding protein [Streptosporangium sp. NPDC006013]|uniref:ATP-binding protein n=1 Tax=Streptosporangium sp. NPDC006013 TaxID=3155596 RepID=UPI0033A1FBDD